MVVVVVVVLRVIYLKCDMKRYVAIVNKTVETLTLLVTIFRETFTLRTQQILFKATAFSLTEVKHIGPLPCLQVFVIKRYFSSTPRIFSQTETS